MASPAQLHHRSRPIRESCLLGFQHPPPDRGGRLARPCRRHNGRSVPRVSSSPAAGTCMCTPSREPRGPEASLHRTDANANASAAPSRRTDPVQSQTGRQRARCPCCPTAAIHEAPPKQLPPPLTSGSPRQLPEGKVHSPVGLHVSNISAVSGQRPSKSRLGAEGSLIYPSLGKSAAYSPCGRQKE